MGNISRIQRTQVPNDSPDDPLNLYQRPHCGKGVWELRTGGHLNIPRTLNCCWAQGIRCSESVEKGLYTGDQPDQHKLVLELRDQVSGASQIWSQFLPQVTFRRHNSSMYLCQDRKYGFIQPVPTYSHHVKMCSPAHPNRKIRYRNQRRNCHCTAVGFGHKVCLRGEFWIGTFLENKTKTKPKTTSTHITPFFPPKLHELGIFTDYHLQNHPSDLQLVRNPIL